ncbi:ribosomal protein uL16 3-hydroxylase [Aggregatibacter actinomycetemcomitans]|uniref:ribosomal protein uL16 3-hydroxylase n=1 Tax=Aggregatibacter actinomycetemcomitans TaxID=714 RepID=UPI00197C85F4|nr:cupin domain-containing protein [Aggregatibacter actinomycetemcomitans]MBN6058726.1 cupin domain-containing protein [Aggregatibacter actinomycetemcomitans]MBN6087223.1 cupin domain-containing protein [Aggregatibacter actinomycetemcomitans]
MNKFCLPQNITPEIFLRDYWQKKPLLIRRGLPEIIGMLEPRDITELAKTEEVVARLIKQHSDDNWELRTSPLSKEDFDNLPEKWSVLVQDMEQWSPLLGNLWRKFDFIPQWQRDDIMVSFAPQGGSVGKHYDEYDVFLVQAYGHRRWQLGKWCEPTTEFKPNQPIRIFDDMGELILDEVMAPGDVLYVPSRLVHYGVAQDDCLTVSFGLRYPNTSELLESIRNHLYHPSLEVNELAIPFRLSPSEQKTGELTPQDVQQMKALFLQQLANSAQFDTLFQQALATTVSRRRYELLEVACFSDPEDVLESFEHGGRLRQDNNCKLVYTQDPFRIYANGEWLDELTYAEAEILKQLADGQTVDFAFLTRLIGSLQDQRISMEVLVDSICNWLDDGWALLTE